MSSPRPTTAKRKAKEVYLAFYVLLFVSGCIISERLLHCGSPADKGKVSWYASEDGVTLAMVVTVQYARADSPSSVAVCNNADKLCGASPFFFSFRFIFSSCLVTFLCTPDKPQTK